MCYFRYFLWVSNIKTSNGSQSMIYSENVVLYRILLNFVRGLLTVKFSYLNFQSAPTDNAKQPFSKYRWFEYEIRITKTNKYCL